MGGLRPALEAGVVGGGIISAAVFALVVSAGARLGLDGVPLAVPALLARIGGEPEANVRDAMLTTLAAQTNRSLPSQRNTAGPPRKASEGIRPGGGHEEGT